MDWCWKRSWEPRLRDRPASVRLHATDLIGTIAEPGGDRSEGSPRAPGGSGPARAAARPIDADPRPAAVPFRRSDLATRSLAGPSGQARARSTDWFTSARSSAATHQKRLTTEDTENTEKNPSMPSVAATTCSWRRYVISSGIQGFPCESYREPTSTRRDRPAARCPRPPGPPDGELSGSCSANPVVEPGHIKAVFSVLITLRIVYAVQDFITARGASGRIDGKHQRSLLCALCVLCGESLRIWLRLSRAGICVARW